MAEQVKVKILHTCERRVVDAKDKAEARTLREGQVLRIDAESAAVLKSLGYAEDA